MSQKESGNVNKLHRSTSRSKSTHPFIHTHNLAWITHLFTFHWGNKLKAGNFPTSSNIARAFPGRDQLRSFTTFNSRRASLHFSQVLRIKSSTTGIVDGTRPHRYLDRRIAKYAVDAKAMHNFYVPIKWEICEESSPFIHPLVVLNLSHALKQRCLRKDGRSAPYPESVPTWAHPSDSLHISTDEPHRGIQRLLYRQRWLPEFSIPFLRS